MSAWTDKSIFEALADCTQDRREAWWAAPEHQAISPAQRASAERLLASHDLLVLQASAFLAEPAAVQALSPATGAQADVVPDDATAVPQGTQWGPWRIGRELGRGGMGVVYEAERVADFAQRVALKVIRPGLTDPEVFRRFDRERRSLARLEHSHIARLIDGGVSPEGRPYFVMERVDGVDLEAAARSRTLGEILSLFLQLCTAVAHAHRCLLVHRDIKPSNVWVTPHGEVKLLDFGVAKLLEDGQDDTPGATVFGWRVLTPHHAAPEQLQGLPVSTATDIYAIGALLYRVLTGAPPTGQSAASPEEVARSVLEERPIPPSRHPGLARGFRDAHWARSLTPALDAVVLRCLEKRAALRYPSVDALQDDLAALHAGQPLVHIDLGSLARLRTHWEGHRLEWATAGMGLAGLALGVGGAALRGQFAVTVAMVALAGTSLAAVWYGLRAARSRDQATEHLTQLRHLLRTVLLDYHDLVEPLPGSAPVRHRMVNDAVVFLERLGTDVQAPRAVRRDIGTGWRKVGFVQRNGFRRPHMGDTAGALRSYDAGLAILERLRQEDPDDAQTAYEWAMTLSAKAGVVGEDGATDEALRALHRAAAVFEAHAGREGPPHAHRLEWARSHLRCCDVLWVAGRLTEALEVLKQALWVLDSLEERAPRHPELPHVRVWAYGAGARVYRTQGHWLGVETAVHASEDILRALTAQQPTNARFREDLAGVLIWRSAMAARLGDLATTERAIGEALATLEPLFAADPTSIPTRGLWTDALLAQGRDLLLASDGLCGRTELERADARIQALLQEYPEDGDLQARGVLAAAFLAWARSDRVNDPTRWDATERRLSDFEDRQSPDRATVVDTLQAVVALIRARAVSGFPCPPEAPAWRAACVHIRALQAEGRWVPQGWSRFGEDDLAAAGLK